MTVSMIAGWVRPSRRRRSRHSGEGGKGETGRVVGRGEGNGTETANIAGYAILALIGCVCIATAV